MITVEDSTITCDEFKNRLVALCVQGHLSGFPRKPRDRHILLKSIVLTLDLAQAYAERDINEKLKEWLANTGRCIDLDHVSMRRELVDEGYLQRDSSGARYRISAFGPSQKIFETAVDDIDPFEVICTGRALAEKRKQEHMQSGPGGLGKQRQ